MIDKIYVFSELTLCANIDVASNEGGIYALFEVSQGKYFEASTAT